MTTERARRYHLTIPLPTWTINAQRGMHYRTHGPLTAAFRATTRMLAHTATIPQLERVAIDATPSGPRIRQDVGAAYHSVKAAIDGLVDAHIIPNDTPQHVNHIVMRAPTRGPHGLHLTIIDLEHPDNGDPLGMILERVNHAHEIYIQLARDARNDVTRSADLNSKAAGIRIARTIILSETDDEPA